MELKTTKVYVPIENAAENIYALCIFKDYQWNHKQDLKERELYTFTKEELEEFKKQIAGDAFDAGARHEFHCTNNPDKQQYIKQILIK